MHQRFPSTGLSEIYLSYDAVAYLCYWPLLWNTGSTFYYHAFLMSGLLKACLMKKKRKENQTASGTSLRSMILPEMISGAQLSHIWSQKELIPLSATSDKTKHTFLTLLMRWKGKQRFKPEISGWKRARASFKCNTLLLQHYYILYSSDSCASILKVP